MKAWKEYQEGKGDGTSDPDPDSDPAPDENPGALAVQLKDFGLMVAAESMLPAVVAPRTELAVRKAQQHTWGHILGTYCDTKAHVQNVVAALSAQRREPQHATASHGAAETKNLPAVLPKKNRTIALRQSADALEESRKRLGLDELRDNLLDALEAELDPGRAVAMLSMITQEFLGKPCKTIKDVNAFFPHLTLTELSFVSLLKEFPDVLAFYGTSFDPSPLINRESTSTTPAEMQKEVPQQLTASVDGISYTTDAVDIANMHRDTFENDPYAVLGITGHRLGMNTTEYHEKVRKMIAALVPLMMSNKRLYEKVRRASTESLQVGVGRIAALALERCAAEGAVKSDNVQSGIDALGPQQKDAYHRERASLDRKIALASVYDGSRNLVKMHAEDVYCLIGILHHVPACLIAEEPFEGFIQPYGLDVRFFASDGTLVESCALSPVHTREGMLSLHDEMTDGSGDNRTVAALMKKLKTAAQGKILDAFKEKDADVSTLEETAMDLWLQRGPTLEVLGLPVIRSTVGGRIRDVFANVRVEKLFTGKRTVVDANMKIGADEAAHFLKTLALLPRELLKRVKAVRKVQDMRMDLRSIMTGMSTEGTYMPKTKTITISESVDMRFPLMSPMAKAARSFTIIHEAGEALWTELAKTEQSAWKSISWKGDEKTGPVEEHFLTHYAHHVGSRDDFCEHFAAYVLHADEFRGKAQTSQPLLRKYECIRDIIEKRAGKAIEYPMLVPWTLEQIHGELEKEVSEKSIVEAWDTIERNAEALEEQAKDTIDEVRKSFETLVEDEQREQEAEELEDSVDREIARNDDSPQNTFVLNRGRVEPESLHAFGLGISQVLERVLEDEDSAFIHPIRDAIGELVFDGDWESVETVLREYCRNARKRARIVRLLRDIELPQVFPSLEEIAKELE